MGAGTPLPLNDVRCPQYARNMYFVCWLQQDEVGDGMPQSIMGDYTVGAELLRSQEHRRTRVSQRTSSSAQAIWENNLHSPDPLADDSQHHQREIAMRPPTPTRLTEASEVPSKRIQFKRTRMQALSATIDGTPLPPLSSTATSPAVECELRNELGNL